MAGTMAYQKLGSLRDQLQDILSRILELRKAGKSGVEVKHLVSSAGVLLVELRGLNRAILVEEESVKNQTEAAKGPVDSTTLKLHNLLYEKNHYRKAIKACKDFKSQFTNIELVSESAFLQDAPEQFRLLSQDGKEENQVSMPQRLNFELHQRKELSKQKEELEARKRSLEESIASRKKFLGNLPSHLKALKKASLPVQQQLGILQSQKMKQLQHAELLPAPLYILYTQLAAYRDAFDSSLEVLVEGRLKDAEALLKAEALAEAGVYGEDVKFEEAPEEDDEGQRRRKRTKRVIEEQKEVVEGVHPLKVILHVYNEGADGATDPKRQVAVVVQFEFLSRLQIVCASVVGDEGTLLSNLFPDDTGMHLPDTASKLRASAFSSVLPGQVGKPYKWAQHLAGLDFLPELPLQRRVGDTGVGRGQLEGSLAQYRAQHRIPTVISQLRCRVRAQAALKEQLETLSKHKRLHIPSAIIADESPLSSFAPKCTLHSWTPFQPPQSTSVLPASGGNELAVPDGTGITLPTEGGREDGELPLAPATTQASQNSKDNGGGAPLQPLALAISEAARLRSAASATMRPHSSSAKGNSRPPTPQPGAENNLSHGSDSHPSRLHPAPLIVHSTTELPIADEVLRGLSGRPWRREKEAGWEDFGVRRFRGVFRRELSTSRHSGQRLDLEAMVSISVEYPVRAPLLSLRLISGPEPPAVPSTPPGLLQVADTSLASPSAATYWAGAIQRMESQVNLCAGDLPVENRWQVLTYQLVYLQMLLDTFVDSEIDHLLTRSNSSKSMNTDSPVSLDVGKREVTGEGANVSLRTTRGKSRARPVR